MLGFPPGAVVDGPEVWRRDAYGFAVRPQHLQRFREYAKIYKVVMYFAVLEMFCFFVCLWENFDFAFLRLFVRKRRRRGRTDGGTS